MTNRIRNMWKSYINDGFVKDAGQWETCPDCKERIWVRADWGGSPDRAEHRRQCPGKTTRA